jgi:glutaredoxin
MATVTLYGTPGCHLCDDARAEIERVRARVEFDLEEVDVSLDAVLHREYGERIPVVTLDGEEVFEYHVDPEGLERLLGRVAGP